MKTAMRFFHKARHATRSLLGQFIARCDEERDRQNEGNLDPECSSRLYLFDETAEQYRERLIQELIDGCGESQRAHQLIIDTIDNISNGEDREHAVLHEVRHLTTYKLTPSGPGKILDIGGPSVSQDPLAKIKGWHIKTIPVLSMDFETERLPFEDNSFEGVLLCEVLEHFISDPLYCIIEINRVLRDDGFLILTTPNTGSWFAVYQALQGLHPNRWPVYGGPSPDNHHHIHAREYLPSEVDTLIKAAGFRIETLITKDYGINPQYKPMSGFPSNWRGETIFCLARKIGPPIYRQVEPIYLKTVTYEPESHNI